tara:strand:- start:1147 stop:1554 length:408 start_codon:yes stop_codon:yes gene_type:complete
MKMAFRSLNFGHTKEPTLSKNDDMPKKNDDLVQVKIFTYNLQVENTLATWVRNGLLSIRIAFLFHTNESNSPWIGKLVFFVGPTVILWSVIMYILNTQTVARLTKSNKQAVNMYIWPILASLFSAALYASAFELV